MNHKHINLVSLRTNLSPSTTTISARELTSQNIITLGIVTVSPSRIAKSYNTLSLISASGISMVNQNKQN
jgi:hypothetical protein